MKIAPFTVLDSWKVVFWLPQELLKPVKDKQAMCLIKEKGENFLMNLFFTHTSTDYFQFKVNINISYSVMAIQVVLNDESMLTNWALGVP